MKQIFKERFNRTRMLFSLFIFLLRGYGCEESEVSEKSEIVSFDGMEFRMCAKCSLDGKNVEGIAYFHAYFCF